MSTKNFVSYGDAETLFTDVGNKLSTLKSGLTNLENELNGDSTVYPYADVITIEDAIPANLAECTVKIEPVQDLHGYDHPWVGGAGDNKLYINPDFVFPYSNNGITITSDGNGGVYINGTTTDGVIMGTPIFKTDNLTGQNTLCKLSSEEVSTGSVVYEGHYPNGNYYSGVNGYDTVNTDGYWSIKLYFPSAGRTFNNVHLQPMVIMGNSHPTEYIPYENLCPITGHTEASVQRTGKNLADPSKAQIYDRYIILGGTTGGYMPDGTLVLDAGTYTASCNTTAEAISVRNNHETVIESVSNTNNITFTLNGTTPIRLAYVFANEATRATTFQLEKGSTATPYVPYAGKTYTIALGDTIYGGTVNFKTGVMTVTHGIVDLGTLTWYKYQSLDHLPVRFATRKNDIKNDSECVCEVYPSADVQDITTSSDKVAFVGDDYINVADSSYSDSATFKTAMDGVQLCYELATPFTIQLTPTQIQLLKGTNTITASTGQISVTVNGVSRAIGALTEDVADLQSGLIDVNGKFNGVSFSLSKGDTPVTGVTGNNIGVLCMLAINGAVVSNGNIGETPSAYKPSTQQQGACIVNISGNNYNGMIQVNNTGVVYIRYFSDGQASSAAPDNATVYGNITWAV